MIARAIQLAALGVLLVLAACDSPAEQSRSSSSSLAAPGSEMEATALRAAEELILETVRGPATIRVSEKRILDRKGNKYLLACEVVLENDRGAVTSHTYWVIVEVDPSDPDNYSYNRAFAVRRATGAIEADLLAFKLANQW